MGGSDVRAMDVRVNLMELERQMRLKYPEAALVASKIINKFVLCAHGQEVAWKSCPFLQRAIDDGRRGDPA